MRKTLVKDPIYHQLARALREIARSGELKPGEKFLTERQIGEQFGVSRATANKALAGLVSEGLLEFRKGVGTFVSAGTLDFDLRALVSFTEKALAAGKRPSTKVLCLKTMKAERIDSAIAVQLRLEADEEVYYVERLRLASGVPVILERRHIVARYCPKLKQSDLKGSLYALWTDKFHLAIAGADQTIRAIAIKGEEARILNTPEKTAGLLTLAEGYLEDGSPLWVERTVYRGDAYEFRNRLGPLRSARPASGVVTDVNKA